MGPPATALVRKEGLADVRSLRSLQAVLVALHVTVQVLREESAAVLRPSLG